MARILFFLKKTKGNTGRHFLYCRITVNFVSRDFSLEQQVPEPDLWSQDRQRYLGTCEGAEFINLLIEKITHRIKTSCLLWEGPGDLTPDKILAVIKPQQKKPVTLLQVVDDYIEWEKAQLGLSTGTLRHRTNYRNNLVNFCGGQVYATDVTLSWAEKFLDFLRTRKEERYRCKSRTRASRHIEYFKKALDKAVEQKKINSHELVYFKARRDPKKKIVYLNEAEREIWLNAKVVIGPLIKAYKISCFQILVGVSFMDLWATYEVRDVPGAGKILIGRRGKTDECFYVPYDPLAEEILQSFNFQIPKIDYNTYNEQIKIVAGILGICKHMTTHVARKTFIMHLKNNGWDMRTVMEAAGHKTIRTTEYYYMEASPERLINEMQARKKLEEIRKAS